MESVRRVTDASSDALMFIGPAIMKSEFFEAKRPWSRYKDAILEYYLEPYIPKVSSLKKPVLIVDCCAGCGRFADGGEGSPLIIAKAINRWREEGHDVSGEFVESDSKNFEMLKQSLSPYQAFAKLRHTSFETSLPEYAQRAKTESVFLYVDPYTVKSLNFAKMNEVYSQVRSARSSVEVLMNFNVAIFMRWALAALKRVDELPVDATNEDADYQADDPLEKVEIAVLNSIAGGSYWQTVAKSTNLSFADKLHEFTKHYIGKLRHSFDFVCGYPVKSKYEHQVPKYMLIFATRHIDGIELMNDAMCKARKSFLGARFVKGMLFDMTPAHESADLEGLDATVLEAIGSESITRRQVRSAVLERHFCRYPCGEINKSVRRLLKERRLYSASGRIAVNDDVPLKLTPFSDK